MGLLENNHNAQHSSSQKVSNQLGISKPVSTAEPKPEDITQTKNLLQELRLQKVIECQQGITHRSKIVAKLDKLVKKWVIDVSIRKKKSPEYACTLGGKVYTFGSYRLGVYDKGADIDALCVAPRNIERFDFFTSFFELLQQQPEVTGCRAIIDSFVPVIKMNFDGIEIDLVFARMALEKIPEDLDLSDDKLLKNLHPSCVRSLNGVRVTEQILRLVPNLENYRLTLRAIKLWAKKSGIYSNMLGYFGGVTWAMLVARTCQLYPNAVAATLVDNFFLVYSEWNWEEPVLLKHPHDVDRVFAAWDYSQININGNHLMPIITPAYPQQNSTFNVSSSTSKLIKDEIKAGRQTTGSIIVGNDSWGKLFQPQNFFSKYIHFLVLIVQSDTADDHLEWSGLIESKIRILIRNLEQTEHIKLAHVNPKSFMKKQVAPAPVVVRDDENIQETMWFIGLEFNQAANLNVNLVDSIQSFIDLVVDTADRITIFRDGMNVNVKHLRRKELHEYIDSKHLERKVKIPESEKTASQQGSKRPLAEEGQLNSSAAKRPKYRDA